MRSSLFPSICSSYALPNSTLKHHPTLQSGFDGLHEGKSELIFLKEAILSVDIGSFLNVATL